MPYLHPKEEEGQTQTNKQTNKKSGINYTVHNYLKNIKKLLNTKNDYKTDGRKRLGNSRYLQKKLEASLQKKMPYNKKGTSCLGNAKLAKLKTVNKHSAGIFTEVMPHNIVRSPNLKTKQCPFRAFNKQGKNTPKQTFK